MEVGLSLKFLSLHVQQFIAKYDLTLLNICPEIL